MNISKETGFGLARYQNSIRPSFSDTAYRRDNIYSEFDSMTVRFARDLLNRSNLSPDESFLCRFYSGDTTVSLADLTDEQYLDSRLREAYVDAKHDFSEPNVRFTGGVWVPVGDRWDLGIHPTLGVAFGVDWYRSAFYFAFNGSFIKTPDDYVVYNDGVADTTSDFQLLTGEAQFVYKFWRVFPKEFQLTLAAGWQGFGNSESKIHSVSGAIGCTYRNYAAGYGKRDLRSYIAYFAVEPRIEFSRIDTEGGTDLSGVAITIRFSFGWGGV